MGKAPILDLSRCAECEACLALCPSVFKRSEAGYIEVAELSEYPEDCVREAMNCCPADCITWDGSD